MQKNQDLTGVHIQCRPNDVLCRCCYRQEPMSKWNYMGNYLSELWKSGEWKLIFTINVFFTDTNYMEPLIDEAHVETAYGAVLITIKYASDGDQWQSLSACVQSFLQSRDTCQRVKLWNKSPLGLVTTLDVPVWPFSNITMHVGQLTTVSRKCSTIESNIEMHSHHVQCIWHLCTILNWCSTHDFLIPIPCNFKDELCTYTYEVYFLYEIW